MAKHGGMTDLTIVNLKPKATRYEVRDHGARGLRVVVQPSGVKSFAVRYELKGGKSVKLTLGRWVPPADRKKGVEPKIGDALSLGQARVLAAAAMNKVTEGLDPAGEKREAKEERKQATANTFRAIAEEYLKRVCGMKVDARGNVTFDRDKKRTGRERDQMLRRSVYPVIGDRPIADIKRRNISALLDRIEDERGVGAADRTLALLSTIFNWHAARDGDFATPIVKGMSRDERKPHERARDRKLSDDEIRVVWKVAETQGPFGALVRYLMLTAARRTEASGMVCDELDGSDWTLPAARNKTGLDLVRPLSPAALAVIDDQPKIMGCQFVFSNDGKNPISGYSKFKKRFDDAVLQELRKHDPKAQPLPGWVLHDLRRSARSLMSRAGVNWDHAERCLGHIIGGVRGTYDRHEFYDEKKRAFEAIAAQIERIVSPPPGNVLPFQKAGE
jgi:hypothetical protein